MWPSGKSTILCTAVLQWIAVPSVDGVARQIMADDTNDHRIPLDCQAEPLSERTDSASFQGGVLTSAETLSPFFAQSVGQRF